VLARALLNVVFSFYVVALRLAMGELVGFNAIWRGAKIPHITTCYHRFAPLYLLFRATNVFVFTLIFDKGTFYLR
jgi:hypothetical protein